MAKTLFGDEAEATGTTVFGDPAETPPGVAREPLNVVEAEDRAGEVWDISIEQETPLNVTDRELIDIKEVKTKHDSTSYWRGIYTPTGPVMPSFVTPLPFPVRPIKTLAEVPKGVARFLQRDFAGSGGTMFDWLGQLIQEGGAALDWWGKVGSKNKSQIYNPLAESIIATGENISKFGKESRRIWAWEAANGWEAFDRNLKETDPISYGAGRISDSLSSSALAVLAAYLSGGTTIAPSLVNYGLQINRGLVALSYLSAAGSFEHAQNQKENFYWSTVHAIADGGIEYGMESAFLKDIPSSTRFRAGLKESGEEFFTGMIQNMRAGILENSNKGMSAYEAVKTATISSLSQSPWEMAAGFIGGYGIKGGADLMNLVQRGNQIPLVKPEIKAEKVAPVAEVPAEVAKIPPAEVTPPTPEQVTEQELKKVKKLTGKALTELGKAERPRAIIEVEKTKELGRRAARSAAAAERTTGEERLASALGQLKGELTEYKRPDFTPLKNTMSKVDIDALHDDVWVRPWSEDHFDRLNTAKAWSKVVEGFVPTRGEILLLERQWGKEFAKGLLKKQPLGDRAWDTAADISNFMRTMLAGGDVSVAGRQLRVMGQQYPKEFGKAVKQGLGAYRSEALAKIMRADYEASEYHKEAKKYLQFFDPAGTEATPPAERPEWYMSHYPEKVPVLGHIIRMGNRNYVETMNMFTQSIWDKLRAQDKINVVEPSVADLELRGKWLMSMTGRPEIGGVVGRRIAPIASGFFFAPRFAVSRFTSPTYLRHLASGDPVAREVGRNTAKAFASFIGTNIAILALLKLSMGDDIEIELDPRSPDWGKARIGNTRIDLWAGYQQAARFLVQMILGQYKTQAGKIKETERLETIGRFIRGKENPLVSLISDLYKGKTYEGDRPFSPPKGKAGEILDELKIPDLIQGVGKESYNRMLFMWVQDFVDASVNDGWIMGFTAGTLSFFGTNTSAYEDTVFTKIAKFKNNLAQTEHGRNWNELNSSQQKRLSRINKQVLADFELQAKIEGARRDDYDYVGRLIEDEKKAGKKIYKKLKPENRKLLDETGISLGLSRRIGDWEIDDTRYEQYQKITTEILDTKLSKLSGMSGWKDISIKRRITKVELAVQISKDKAKNIVRREAKKEQD